MFKGSARFGAGDIDHHTQAVGGSNNAYTSHDSTVYVFSLPAAHWRLALEVEADRMAGLNLDPAEVDAERQVILEELAEVEGDPWDSLEMAVMDAFFGDHPYGRRILGDPESLRSTGPSELAAFHCQACSPSNAVLTVAGAIDRSALELAAELFGDLGGPVSPGPTEPSLPNSPLRRITVDRGRSIRGLFAMPSPSAASPEFVALRLGLTAICSGRASALQRLLVDEGKLCQTVSSTLTETVHPGMASIAVEVLPGVEPQRVEDVLLAELERVLREGLDADAVERARRLLVSDWLFSHETIEQRGATAGVGLALFGADYGRRQHRVLLGAGTEDIERALARCFDSANPGVVGWAGI